MLNDICSRPFQKNKRQEGSTGQKGKQRGKGKEKNRGCQENSANSCNGTLHFLTKTVVRTFITLERVNNHWGPIKSEWMKAEASICTEGNMVSSLVLLRSFNATMQTRRKRLSTLLVYWAHKNNTSVIVLIKNSSTVWCLVTLQRALPLCSTSIQSSSFLNLTLLGATFSHHSAVNKWIALRQSY